MFDVQSYDLSIYENVLVDQAETQKKSRMQQLWFEAELFEISAPTQ
jgi:hypothetical protein